MDTKTAFELSTSAEICAELGRRLREQRLAQNLSQAELAARAGLHRRTIENLETKTHTASLETIVKVAVRLNVVAQLQDLFVLKVQSIAQMERAEWAKRRRASRKRDTP
jgi:transcriptional regulator with XRE-family HTH domain